ncbi:hypothetical protein EJ02DRAFT_488723 [Clathrospora elynae]|uniref:Nephrocystin 3-like N-terminal domain-containing protein n=1 Tax=Clathrospora elynae TaxID=706981 RepID=A0A6A5S4H4_9PLEO|nr:hypothetical protein EJ02DRAFT_488723 [Clathrospora elynae]
MLSRHSGLENHLSRLPHAEHAPFNSLATQHELTCLAGTRFDLLERIHSWADEEDELLIFWLNGLAGTGKSTIARTVARSYYDRHRLAASFFFSRGGGDVSHAGRLVTSIAVQLADNVPASRQHIRDAIAERSDIASQSLRDQWQHLVIRPLSMLAGLSSYVMVVDALDECNDDNSIHTIVQLLAEARSLERVRLRVFLPSRPELPIRYGFSQISDVEHQDFVLHNIPPTIVDRDITIFLNHNLGQIARKRELRDWPSEDDIETLVRNAGGLFIWAATAYRLIEEAPLGCTTPAWTKGEKQQFYKRLKNLLGGIITLFSPLPIAPLSKLLLITEKAAIQTIKDLHAILDIPKEASRPLRLHHPSFHEKQAHTSLAHNCIVLMSSSLKQDVCGVSDPGVLAAEMERKQLEQCILPELQYACLYWLNHLAKSGIQLRDNEKVHKFLKKHCLHWLEALSWMGKVSEGIHAIRSLESINLVSRFCNVFRPLMTII